MTISTQDLKKIADLAYLDTPGEQTQQLAQDISAIMDFVDTLRAVDTTSIPPLFHPLDIYQALRPDTVTEEDCINQLKEIAPSFEDSVYLVPKVVDAGN